MASTFEKAVSEMRDLLKNRRPICEVCSCVSGPVSAILEVTDEFARDSYGVLVTVNFPDVENGVDFGRLKIPQWWCDANCTTMKNYLLAHATLGLEPVLQEQAPSDGMLCGVDARGLETTVLP